MATRRSTVDGAAALAELKARITQDLDHRGQEAWFFLFWDGVRGWEGTDPVFFVGLNPSEGRRTPFPSKADQLFYRSLAAHGFADAHLTDVVKAKATNKHAPAMLRDQDLMALHRAWFLEEVRIIQPRLVVALTRKVESLLRDWIPGIPLAYVPHYAWAKRWGKEARFADAVAALAADLVGVTR